MTHVTDVTRNPVCTATATFRKKYDTGGAWRRLMYGGRTRITRKMVALCFINDNKARISYSCGRLVFFKVLMFILGEHGLSDMTS